MKTSIILSLVAAMPLMAQEPAPAPAQAPACNCPCRMHHPGFEARKAKCLEKFDTNKDGQLDDQEKEAMKAAREARRAEHRAKFMEKFDTNKDGQLDEQEKEAVKAAFEARRGERGDRPHGPHHKGACGRPHGPRPKGACGCPHGPRPEGARCPAGDAPKPPVPAPAPAAE